MVKWYRAECDKTPIALSIPTIISLEKEHGMIATEYRQSDFSRNYSGVSGY
jgi:hypothetical protein